MLIRENEQLLHETGLFRFHQPKAFGGMELDFVAVVDIPAELARGCPSTAWNVGNLACHHWILGYYDPETQREVWDANPDALIASSIALAAGRARKADGGFIVNGRWPFSSGVDNSDWNMLAVTGLRRRRQDAHRLAAVPGAEVRLRDHRHLVRHGHGGHRQQGRRGHRAVRARAPRPAAPAALPRRFRASGRRAQPRAPLPHPASWPPPAIRWRRRRSVQPKAPTSCSWSPWPSGQAPTPAREVADFQAVQIKVARARCLIDSARYFLRQSAIAFQDGRRSATRCRTSQTKLRFRAHSAFAVNQAREAVETLWSCYGAQGLYTRDPLQRHLRDVLAISQHFSFNFDIAGAAYGLAALGGRLRQSDHVSRPGDPTLDLAGGKRL